MKKTLLAILCLAVGCATTSNSSFVLDPTEQGLDLQVDGKTWLRTMITPFDPNSREETYKVYTHIFDFDGQAPITKGPGGKYTHHRGMFIGWKDTLVGGQDYDTWHMPNCYQQHVRWLEKASVNRKCIQSEEIEWCADDGTVFIKEVRTITAQPGANGLRIFDFASELTSCAGTIQLRGDLQHAGMQVRMANEVSEHEDSTQYILSEGAEELDNDKVVGAWWTCCSPVVRGQRYWLIHMTPQDHLTGQPVYSIRRYARFGAFWENDLEEGKPVQFHFRIVLSDHELDRAAGQALYDEYAS